MKIRVMTKFTDKVIGDIPYFGSEIISTLKEADKVMRSHIKAVEDNPNLMVEFKLTNVSSVKF